MEGNQEVNVWEKIVKNSIDLQCTLDQHGYFATISQTFTPILGYKPKEVIGRNISELMHPADAAITLTTITQAVKDSQVHSVENRFLHKNGHEVFISWSVAFSEKENTLACIGRETTAQHRARQTEELYQVLAEHGTDILALFDEQLNFLYCGASVVRELGYQPAELIGTNALDYVHPADRLIVSSTLAETLVNPGQIIVYDFRFRDASGNWRWLATRGSNQLNNPAVRALVTSSRDITQRINYKLSLEESEERFRSLFDHHPDMVFYQDQEGIVLNVNKAAITFHGVEKEEFLNRTLNKFLSPEMLRLHKQMLSQTLQGITVRQEVEVPIEGKGMHTIDILKIPVFVKGNAIGVYSILRNVTEIHHSHKTIRRQAEKLNTILESITDAFFTLDHQWKFSYINSELERLFQVDRATLLGKDFWELADTSIKQELYRQYAGAVKTGKAAHFEILLEQYDMWLQVKAFPSEEGLSVFMADITEKVRSRNELEKLSLVASKTTNGVVITDANGLIEWVNEGFTSLTGYTLQEVMGKLPASFLFGDTISDATRKRYTELQEQYQPFQEELLNYKKSGEPIWLLLDTTPVFNQAGELVRYVTLQKDITERKEAEESRLQLTKDLFRQNKDLQQFTYIVSHNLRSPVANALGLVDVLSMIDKNSDTFGVSLGYLKKSVNQLDTVLKDLNTVLSIRDKRDPIDREQVALQLVCQQVVEDLDNSLKACGATVSLDIGENLHVQGDKAYLYSIFHNLLSNAIKYRSPKRALKIQLKCFGSTERGTLISLSDNGSGFDMRMASDKVFKLYKRFHPDSEGRGIGLFLVKTHLNAMGGHIEVSSQVNVGTRFLIYLK